MQEIKARYQKTKKKLKLQKLKPKKTASNLTKGKSQADQISMKQSHRQA